MKQSDLKKWAAAWERAGERLERERIEALRQPDYRNQLHLLDDAIDWSIKNSPLLSTSGLVEQQAIFARLRKKL